MAGVWAVIQATESGEILAEVFWIRLSDADDMIENRLQTLDERCSKNDGLWPQEL